MSPPKFERYCNKNIDFYYEMKFSEKGTSTTLGFGRRVF